VSQAAVTKAELKEPLKRIRARVAKNPDSPAWQQLDARWEAIVGHAEGILAEARSGRAGIRHERVAAEEIVKLHANLSTREIVQTVLAMFVLLEVDPRRFRGDAAFRAQLVRRVRGLTELNAATYNDKDTGRPKRVYRELPPRASVVMGEWLATALGGAGLHLARLEQEDAERRHSEAQALHEALRGLR
jgi:hypothetical protein